VIRILIAVDHEIVRRGLKQIIAEHPDMIIAGEAVSGEQALELAVKQNFDIAIIDIAMPGRGGLDILKDLRVQRPALKIIILSMYSDEQYAIRSMRDGASAYITKANATVELLLAIETVALGKRYITSSVADRLASYIEDNGSGLPHERLSNRELQVLGMIGSGRSMTEIASQLSLSIKTVSTYRARLLERMGMKSTAQLIKYAVEHQLQR